VEGSARALAAQIPGARLVLLGGDAGGDMDRVLAALADFLGDGVAARRSAPPPPPEAAAGLRTILFTDVESHTAMMQRLGDVAGRAILREHEEITRGVLRQFGGVEVKAMGDGFMATFGSVIGAVQCAIELQRAFARRNATAAEPVLIRVGLNAGEPIAEDGDYFGSAVILAARIAAQGGGGEIVASLAVRELCAGKGIPFSDRGDVVLRGFEDPVRVYEVSWQEPA
jgi:adenylate cyclase